MNNITGKAWVFGDDINTDLIYPQICYTLPEAEKPFHAMEANRPGWATLVGAGDIIIGGRNFGTGSSRPAADNLKKLGISCIIAESVNGLFLRNAVNTGIMAIEASGVHDVVDEGDTITVDLENCRITDITNQRSVAFRGLPPFLMEIIENGGIINVLRAKGLLGKPL
ncbi:MAG: 3-isopropylmalate dehydratase [Ferroplasma sp.]|uniref:LeuD/DmdB family oxidoreductase small subunit n=1 Tax=Ferroplasma sp. TaxID=2591003 RepID=UPI002815C25B|nr:3-isopropylmalate dehydratase [Ferroplasma sp.]WMT51519.1 MAG: 3-isopropylmalate dehydratase [Ferroplasma sp.]